MRCIDHLLLALGIRDCELSGVRHAEVFEHSRGAIQTRFTGDVCLVDGGREAFRRVRSRAGNGSPLGGHQRREGVPPGPLVRRIDEYPIHIKNDGADEPALIAPGDVYQEPMPVLLLGSK